jgi:hypothetical protein
MKTTEKQCLFELIKKEDWDGTCVFIRNWLLDNCPEYRPVEIEVNISAWVIQVVIRKSELDERVANGITMYGALPSAALGACTEGQVDEELRRLIDCKWDRVFDVYRDFADRIMNSERAESGVAKVVARTKRRGNE